MLGTFPMLDRSSTFHAFRIFVSGDICEEVILYSFGSLFAACLFSEIFSVIYFIGQTLVWGVNGLY